MKAHHWLKTSNFNNNTTATVTISPSEWKMETSISSSKFTPQSQEKGKGKLIQEEDKEDKPKCEWDFTLNAIVSSSSTTASDALGVIEIDSTNALVATGGIARKIRIYECKNFLHDEENQEVSMLEHGSACRVCMCTPAKLSSLKWRPGSGSRVLGSGDYDGVVTEYDLEQRLPVFERDEHSGRRVWSVDYTHFNPVVGASGSDDGTMQMWDTRCDGGACVAKVVPATAGRSAVCCVEFDPFGSALVVAGCADRRAYGYDTRKMETPILVLEGHKRTVTYVKFLDARTIVTSATDGCLKQWRVEDTSVVRTYKGHVNCRNFIGLSVWKTGRLLGCGSENNRVYVYDERWSEPIWVQGFGPVGASGFVSSVCWREVSEDECSLLAGGSDGVLQVFTGKRKPFSYC